MSLTTCHAPVQKSILHYFPRKDVTAMCNPVATTTAKAVIPSLQAPSIEGRFWRLSLHNKSAEAFEREWNANFSKLRLYKKNNGHCNVPLMHGRVGRWVGIQRELKKCRDKNCQSSYDNPPITDEQIRKLDSLGFAWSLRNRRSWADMYAELLLYKAKHGTCNVPQKCPRNKSLGRWVGKQRQSRKKNSLHPSCVDALNRAGFTW